MSESQGCRWPEQDAIDEWFRQTRRSLSEAATLYRMKTEELYVEKIREAAQEAGIDTESQCSFFQLLELAKFAKIGKDHEVRSEAIRARARQQHS